MMSSTTTERSYDIYENGTVGCGFHVIYLTCGSHVMERQTSHRRLQYAFRTKFTTRVGLFISTCLTKLFHVRFNDNH